MSLCILPITIRISEASFRVKIQYRPSTWHLQVWIWFFSTALLGIQNVYVAHLETKIAYDTDYEAQAICCIETLVKKKMHELELLGKGTERIRTLAFLEEQLYGG